MSRTKKGYDLSKIKVAYDAAVPEFHAPQGNTKLGKIPAFNLMPGMTCSSEACSTCLKDGCYAVKNMFCHGYDYDENNTLKAWADNTKLAMEDLNTLEKHLDAFLSIMDLSIYVKFFRIHSAGDFFSVEYAAMWSRLAIKHPKIKFLAFTKQWDVIRQHDAMYTPFHDIDNFSLVLSGWTGCVIPEDLKAFYHCAFCVEHGDVCEDENAIECPGQCEQCGMCWSLDEIDRNTYFNKH